MSTTSTPTPSSRPNILWFSMEDTTPRFGCYGDDVAHTPNLDRLASEGRRYPLMFSTAGVCAPSRNSILLGMYAISSGGHHMRTTHRNRHTPGMATPYQSCPPHYARGFTEYLRAAGYWCSNNDKTDYQFSPPLTCWDECGTWGHWRNRPDPDQPFFAVFNPTITHESGQWEGKGSEPETDPDSVTLPPYLPDTPKARKALARQYDNIKKSDALLGERLRELEEDGLAENTLVVVWSDHGEGLPRSKRWLYDGGIRVPLIVRWPGQVPAGEVSDRLVSGIDLPSTMLSVAGVPIPPHMQGKAFFGEQEDAPREFIHAARDRFDESYDMVRAVRDRRFKYIRNFRPDLPYLLWIPYRNRHPIMQEMWRLYAEDKLTDAQKVFMANSRPPEELYDTENDPFELNNLASNPNHRQTLDRLRAEMERWRQEVGDWGEMPEVEMVQQWHGHHKSDAQELKTQTVRPIVVPLGPDYDGAEPITGEVTLKNPVVLQFHTPTQGAAFSWTLEDGPNATNVPWAEEDPEGRRVHWNLYTGPIRLEPGTHTLRVRATRYGFEESEEERVTVRIE